MKATRTAQVTMAHLATLKFWDRVAVSGASDCWPWTKGCTTNGYGVVHVPVGEASPVALYAHRVAWALDSGGIGAPDLVIDHLCHSRDCCNPRHLEQVDQMRNVRRGIRTATPVANPRKDGTVRWVVRFYDYTSGSRRYLSKSFDDLATAQTFSASLKTERAS